MEHRHHDSQPNDEVKPAETFDRIESYLEKFKKAGSFKEFDRWLIRSGGLPESNLGVSRIGIYTDFT